MVYAEKLKKCDRPAYSSSMIVIFLAFICWFLNSSSHLYSEGDIFAEELYCDVITDQQYYCRILACSVRSRAV